MFTVSCFSPTNWISYDIATWQFNWCISISVDTMLVYRPVFMSYWALTSALRVSVWLKWCWHLSYTVTQTIHPEAWRWLAEDLFKTLSMNAHWSGCAVAQYWVDASRNTALLRMWPNSSMEMFNMKCMAILLWHGFVLESWRTAESAQTQSPWRVGMCAPNPGVRESSFRLQLPGTMVPCTRP